MPDSIITDTTPTIESETKPNEPKQDPLLAWGLGITESEYVLSGERSYDWYMCQRNTGYASSVNCGPAVAAMAAKWSDESFSKTVEDLRNTDKYVFGYPWYIDNIVSRLIDFDLPLEVKDLSNDSSLKSVEAEIQKGNILIFGINLSHLSYSTNPEQRVDLPYPGADFGHYIIVKGYRVVDGIHHFEVYDPEDYGVYQDGSFKSKNRYYRAEEVIASALKHCHIYLSISPKG